MTLKSSLHAFIALATVASLATACQEDESEQLARSNKAISFNIVKSWEQDVTRSASLWTPNKAEYMGCDTLVSDDKQDTLYLERTISDLATESTSVWTRANILTASNLNAFKVSCVKRNTSTSATAYYFQDETTSLSGSIYSTSNTYYWLETGKENYDFYAYAPSDFTGVTNPTPAGAPSFAYDATDGDNCDLMAAAKTGMSDAPADAAAAVVPLTFDHLLSGIRFKVDDDCADIKISKIEIKGLNWSGTCNYSGSSWTWSGLATNASKSLVRNLSPSFDTSGTDKNIDQLDASSNPTEASFFVVPQDIPAEATITLTYMDGAVEKSLSASISGTLEQGKLTTFTLKVEEDAAVKFTVVQEGLHLKITFTKGESQATSLTPSITLANDPEKKELISEQSFYGTGTTPSHSQLAGADGVYYYDGSFFMSDAIKTYNDLQPDDDSGDYSKYCWDSKKSIAENEAVKTQTYVFSLSDGTNTYSKKVKFHFDYLEYTYTPNATNKWVHCFLSDTREGRGNFTMQDITETYTKWRNSGDGKYSDEQLGSDQKMEGLTDTDLRTIRVYISSKDVEMVGYSAPNSLNTAQQTNQKCLITITTPVPKASSGKINFPYAQNMTTVSDALMAKQDNLTDLSCCFYNCKALTSLNLSSFNTEKVTTMESMFYYCQALTSLNLSSFNTENVTKMASMFNGCSGLTGLNVTNFDTSSVTNMNSMFSYCSKLTTLDLSNFDTSSVTTMSQMFSQCQALTTLDLRNFDTSSVTTMSQMFFQCYALTSLNVSSFNTSSVTTMSQMFSYCRVLTTLDVSKFDTSSVTTMSQMFFQCYALTSLNVSSFNTSSVTIMQNMFNLCKTLTSLDVSSFDTSNVTDMGNMFRQCEALTSLDLSNFNTSNVKSISNMFYYCKALESLNLKKFSKDNVSTYTNTFNSIGIGHSNKVTITTNSSFKNWMTNSTIKSKLGLNDSKVTIVTQ